MGSLKQFNIHKNIIDILNDGRIEDKTFFLPNTQLDRSTYDEVNKVLIALGAKWNKKAKGHVFDYDISEELSRVIRTGVVTDWKKSTDFFYTPDNVVNEMLGLVPKPCAGDFSVLEPSAGQGHILDLLKYNFPNVDIHCIEKNPMHCERLKEKGYSPINDDFLNVTPFKVDVVLMNPPFSEEIEHIKHAYDFVEEDGILITIASAMILDKSMKKNKEFKEWFNSLDSYDYPLPANSFKESGTNVNSKMLVFHK